MARKDIISPLKRRRRIIKITLYFLGGIILLMIVAGIFRWSRLSVNHFVFEGNMLVSTNELAAYITGAISGKALGVFPNNNILRVSKKNLKSLIKGAYPDIQSVSIDKDLFSTLRFTISERVKRAVLCEDVRCAFIDEHGKLFKIAPKFSEGVYLEFENHRLGTSTRVWIGDGILPYNEFVRVIDFAKRSGAIRVLLLPEESYEFYTGEGWYIKLASRNDFDKAYINLRTFLENNDTKTLKYVDLRFGDKVFYK